jgi:surface carbohydrate biosynthesis protein (TIGR04326 family)
MRNRNLKKHFKKNTKIYWPLMKDDFDRSFIGVDSFSNLMFLNLFKQAAFRVPKQMKTVYLQENQGWESAFLHYWRKGDHENKILGYPHATVAFWTLMYFNDPRLIYNRGKCHYQIPDSVAVSGNSIKNMYINGQYPENLLTKVESLRFLHLENVSNASFKNNSLKPKLLILGDYEYQNTYKQLKLLIGALAISDIEIDILMKPHPSCPILKEEFPEINMQISNKNISTLLEACSIVYTGNATSASVDAYLSGKKVISVLSPKTPNLSPLRGNSDVVFITSEIELAEALRNMKNLDSGKMNHRDFFFINSDLPLWKKLLST